MILDLFRPALSKVAGIRSLEFKIVRKDKLKNFAANIIPGKVNWYEKDNIFFSHRAHAGHDGAVRRLRM